jgi:hypothetical protein
MVRLALESLACRLLPLIGPKHCLARDSSVVMVKPAEHGERDDVALGWALRGHGGRLPIAAARYLGRVPLSCACDLRGSRSPAPAARTTTFVDRSARAVDFRQADKMRFLAGGLFVQPNVGVDVEVRTPAAVRPGRAASEGHELPSTAHPTAARDQDGARAPRGFSLPGSAFRPRGYRTVPKRGILTQPCC